MKFEGIRQCDVCGDIDVDWYSCDDKNHLCKTHRKKSDTFKCGKGVEEV
jgi:hypothetical protein